MRVFLISAIVIFVGIISAKEIYAQSAYDSACYFPHLGNPTEFDTIYGGTPDQNLGSILKTIPPLKGETYDRLVIQGVADNIPFLTSVETGHSFNLHKLNVIKKYPYIFEGFPRVKFGHFHSPLFTDMVVAYPYDNLSSFNIFIYWGDENGDYDTSRYTRLFPHRIGNYGFYSGNELAPYFGKFTNDTVDDIIVNTGYGNIVNPDSMFVALIKGGQHLYDQGKQAMWDDTVFWSDGPFTSGADVAHRFQSQGDWRGVGREDLITLDDWGNLFYYKNDPPFDLREFVKSLRKDTLLVAKEWPLYKDHFHYHGSPFPMIVFPKSITDKSLDMLVPLPISISDDVFNANGICIFRGGAGFGSKRLRYDSSDFFIHCPGYYSGNFSETEWPTLFDGGDLTGTGNNVLITSGGGGIGYSFDAMYVLGKAMDDKIDVFASYHYAGGGEKETIRATNKDALTYIFSAPAYESPDDQNNGIHGKGSIRILYGTEKIPVHLNPKFAVSEMKSFENSAEHLLAYPNPCDQSTVLTFDNCTGGKMTVDVISSNGKYCQHEETPGGYGIQQYGLSMTDLAAGNYIIRLSCISDGWSTTTHVVKTGAALAPWKLDLHKMIVR